MKNNNEININNNITGVNEMESEEESALKQQLLQKKQQQQPPGSTDDEGEVDEVDYVPASNGHAIRNGILKSNKDNEKTCVVCKQEGETTRTDNESDTTDNKKQHHQPQLSSVFKLKPKKISDCEVKVCVKNNLHTLDKLQLFKFYQRKRSDPTCDRIVSPATQKKPKFTKSITIAKLFGNNYNPKSSSIDSKNKSILVAKPPQYKNEKFHNKTESGSNSTTSKSDNNEDTQSISGSSVLSSEAYAPRQQIKPFKTLSRSFGKLLRRNYSSVDISIPDPEYKVSYLGNVLTGWARGKCPDFFFV